MSRERPPILARPSLPCLSDAYVINLTAGCPLRCRYCYAQSYRNNPGDGRISFYAGSAKRLEAELARKKRKPRLVYFSSATDPFIPIPAILDEQFSMMEMLLAENIPLLIMTKAKIPDRFLQLFSRHSDRVNAQVGLTTTDDRVRSTFEPGATSVAGRLRNISYLVEIGARVELRMDPLIPMLTDTDSSLVALLREVSGRRCREAAASFLHIRPAIRPAMAVRFKDWDFDAVMRRLYVKTARLGGEGCAMLLPSEEYRRERLGAMERMAGEFGITIKSCACKNPDIVAGKCHDRLPSDDEQMDLFR
ncbi:MAG: radical SAM protein [Deltaproteobacteria bacterium]|nr:radical SAM protein [Deltaproteobacteria bacterium]